MGMNRRLLMWLVAALVANSVSLRTAHAQTVTTLDPGAFAPGTNVTDSFAGVTLQAIAFIKGSPAPGSFFPTYTPSLAPVYTANDSIIGSSIFTTPNTFNTGSWGPNWGEVGGACFSECNSTELPDGVDTNLLITFASPVTSVSILDIGDILNGVYMQAYDSSDQTVGSCLTSFSPQAIGNYGCYSVLNQGSSEGSYQTETSILASSSNGISGILIGGYNNNYSVSTIKYTTAAPEIDATPAASGLTLLLGGLLVVCGRRKIKVDSSVARPL
jgi:hypothetical protein